MLDRLVAVLDSDLTRQIKANLHAPSAALKLLSKVIGGNYGIVASAPRKEVKEFIEMFSFSELDMKQRIGKLSGGQKARVALAHFPGAVMVVSHDRFFIDKVATRLLVFDGTPTPRLVEGNWTEDGESLRKSQACHF